MTVSRSIWLAIAEAFACALPVIASNQGAVAEIVVNGTSGLHFMAGNSEDLAAKVEWAWAHPPEMAAMSQAARAEFDAKYTAAAAIKHLEAVYESALRALPEPASLANPVVHRSLQ